MADAAPAIIAAYDHPSQFEPLLPRPSHQLGVLAAEVLKASHILQGKVSTQLAQALRELVRSMNSYYSNRIEGQSTHPLNIDRALKKNFDDEPDTARRQRIALAHIEAERSLEAQGLVGSKALSSAVLQTAHATLYQQLGESDRMSEEGQVIEPGVFRAVDVKVGMHVPPSHTSVGAFLARADEFYRQPWSAENLLLAIACAHHRYSWVHPFLDGNGRACRLQSHAALFEISQGLWSVNRGLARNRDAYYLHLAEADMARQGDLDGRGNLSEKSLAAWSKHFLETCLDQVNFMSRLLDVEQLKGRVELLVEIRAKSMPGKAYRTEVALPLHYILCVGQLTRGEFTQMTGLDERTARKSISQLLADGLLVSDSPKGSLKPGLPLDALGVLFPALYPEAAVGIE